MTRSAPRILLLAIAVAISGCARVQTDKPAPTTPAQITEPEFIEVFPGVRLDRQRRIVEFDGFVPINVNDPDAPDVWLELVVCLVDTREHESLVATSVTPSNIHAAMLLAGFEPGAPGGWRPADGRIVRTSPTGDPVRVQLITNSSAEQRDSEKRIDDAADWILDASTGEALPSEGTGFVFTGSSRVPFRGRDWYAADGGGVVIGLVTFADPASTAMISWGETVSDAASVDEPRWLADPNRTPPFGTAVTVRISQGEQNP